MEKEIATFLKLTLLLLSEEIKTMAIGDLLLLLRGSLMMPKRIREVLQIKYTGL